MRHRQVGTSGLRMSVVGLGGATFGGGLVRDVPGEVWGRLGLEEARPLVREALQLGINYFDLADVHAEGRSEEIVGELVRGVRDDVVIATKWGGGLEGRTDVAWGSRTFIRRAVTASLRRLRTDRIDLFQMHWRDPKTPMEETLAGLTDLVREGKVRYLGASHLAAWEVAEFDWLARQNGFERFVSVQNHYNLLHREPERGLLGACGRFGVGLLPYFGLGKGLLTGRYSRSHPPPDDLRLGGRVIAGPVDDRVYGSIAALAEFARDAGRTLVDLAVAMLLADPRVSAVPLGASSIEHVRSNAAAAEWRLTADELVRLRALLSELDEQQKLGDAGASTATPSSSSRSR